MYVVLDGSAPKKRSLCEFIEAVALRWTSDLANNDAYGILLLIYEGILTPSQRFGQHLRMSRWFCRTRQFRHVRVVTPYTGFCSVAPQYPNCKTGAKTQLTRASTYPPFNILVYIRLEAFQGVGIPTDVKLSLVNSKNFRSFGGGDHSVSYRVRTKATILRNILCGIFVKIGFICCRGEQVRDALIRALDCGISFESLSLFEIGNCIVPL